MSVRYARILTTRYGLIGYAPNADTKITVAKANRYVHLEMRPLWSLRTRRKKGLLQALLRIPPMSKQRMPQSTVTAVSRRSVNRCERCGTDNAQFWSMHHRKPRGMGGSRNPAINSPANVLLLCGSGTTGCHGWVESNRAEAYELGLLVSYSHDPVQVPVQLRYGEVVLLDDGGWQPC